LPADSNYPDVPAGKRLELIARLLRAGYEAPVFCTSHGGFDTHANQHGSAGTDHGTAGPMFVAGAGVKAGVYGTIPSMTDLRNGRLKMHVDFRRVYADMLEWMGMPTEAALGGSFRPMGVMRPT